MNDLDEPDSIVPPALREPERGPPRTWVAVVLTIVLIGAGHIVRGRWQRGLGWHFARFATLPLFFRWTMPTMIVLLALHVAAIVDAVRCEPIEPRPRAGKAWLLCLALFAASVTVALTIRHTIVQSFSIPSGSMIPALQVGDSLFVSKRRHLPARGEIVVFHYPREPHKDLIKRVIGIPGDTVELRADGGVVLNGRPLPQKEEPGDCSYDDRSDEDNRWYSRSCTMRSERIDGHEYRIYLSPGAERGSFAPVTVPPDSYFVLGDNRDNSHDSRYWGFVPSRMLVGTALRTWWSVGPQGVRWERVQQPLP